MKFLIQSVCSPTKYGLDCKWSCSLLQYCLHHEFCQLLVTDFSILWLQEISLGTFFQNYHLPRPSAWTAAWITLTYFFPLLENRCIWKKSLAEFKRSQKCQYCSHAISTPKFYAKICSLISSVKLLSKTAIIKITCVSYIFPVTLRVGKEPATPRFHNFCTEMAPGFLNNK